MYTVITTYADGTLKKENTNVKAQAINAFSIYIMDADCITCCVMWCDDKRRETFLRYYDPGTRQ